MQGAAGFGGRRRRSQRTAPSSLSAEWRKSSLSPPLSPICVEVRRDPDGSVHVRNSRDPGGPVLRFTVKEWQAFAGGVKLGEFEV